MCIFKYFYILDAVNAYSISAYNIYNTQYMYRNVHNEY